MMPHSLAPAQTTTTTKEIVDRARAVASNFAAHTAAAEEARRISRESVQEMLAAGVARILVPPRFGGYGLDFDAWFDVVLEISKVDASHGWCASLIIHHAHVIGQFPEEAQQAVWAEGPDVAIAASFAPAAQAIRIEGGYRVSGQNSTFASGVDHSSWVIVGGFVHEGGAPQWNFFLIPSGEYQVRDTWFTAGMRATGSNTIVTDNVFVPNTRVLSLSDLRDGKGPGGALNDSPIFHTLFFHYAPLTFATPMLGAARGAYEYFREWTKTRRSADGTLVAEKTSIQSAHVGHALATALGALRARLRARRNSWLRRSIRSSPYVGRLALRPPTRSSVLGAISILHLCTSASTPKPTTRILVAWSSA